MFAAILVGISLSSLVQNDDLAYNQLINGSNLDLDPYFRFRLKRSNSYPDFDLEFTNDVSKFALKSSSDSEDCKSTKASTGKSSMVDDDFQPNEKKTKRQKKNQRDKKAREKKREEKKIFAEFFQEEKPHIEKLKRLTKKRMAPQLRSRAERDDCDSISSNASILLLVFPLEEKLRKSVLGKSAQTKTKMEKDLIHLFQKKTKESYGLSYKFLHQSDWKLIPAFQLHEKIRQQFIATSPDVSINDSNLPSKIEELKKYLEVKDQEALYASFKSLPINILHSSLKKFIEFTFLLIVCLLIRYFSS